MQALKTPSKYQVPPTHWSIPAWQNQKKTNLNPNATVFQTTYQSPKQPTLNHELSDKAHSLEDYPWLTQQPHLHPQQLNSPSTNQGKYKADKLKGVELPTFDGEDKVEYEQWKATLMSAVDSAYIAVNEKALKLIKDLGFSVNAYGKAWKEIWWPLKASNKNFDCS